MWRLKTLKILVLCTYFFISDANKAESFAKPKKRILNQIRKSEKNNKKVNLMGTISIPDDIECPYIYLCYKGKLIKIKNTDVSSFTIKDFDCCQLNLLFVSAENLILNTQQNTILTIELCAENKYKFYRLDKTIQNPFDEKSQQLNTWQINEEKLTCIDNEIEVPLNTLIILIDPNSIDFSLQNSTWKQDTNIIDLPKIVIHDIINSTKFEKSCLAFMDIKPFHSQQEIKEILQEKVRRCMII